MLLVRRMAHVHGMRYPVQSETGNVLIRRGWVSPHPSHVSPLYDADLAVGTSSFLSSSEFLRWALGPMFDRGNDVENRARAGLGT